MDPTLSLLTTLADADQAIADGHPARARELLGEARRALAHQSSAPDSLTTQEAATLLGVRSINTVKALIKAGKLPATRTGPRGHYRIPRTALDTYLASPDSITLQEQEHDFAAAAAFTVPDAELAETIAHLREERKRSARR